MVKERMVVHSPIVDDTSYIASMHEMGHIVTPSGYLRDRRNGIDTVVMQFEEEAAWAWARENALVWTAGMQQLHDWAISTYRNAPPIAGGRDSEFGSILDQLFGAPMPAQPVRQVDPKARERMAATHRATAAVVAASIRGGRKR